MTDSEYNDAIARITENVIYEVTFDGIPIYRGQTLKPLDFRLACHIADRKRSSSDYMNFLEKVVQEDNRDKLDIAPINGYETEHEAIEDGPCSLLNAHPGRHKPQQYTGHKWEKEQLERLGNDTDDEIAADLGISQTHVTNVRTKLGINAHNPDSRSLDDLEVRQILILREIDGMTYSRLAEVFDTSHYAVGRIIRGETYADVDRPREELIGVDAARAFAYAACGHSLEQICHKLYATKAAVAEVLAPFANRCPAQLVSAGING